MAEELLPAEVLPIGILEKPRHHSLIAHIVEMLQVVQSYQQAQRQAWAAPLLHVQRAKLPLKKLPIDGCRQPVQWMPLVQQRAQARLLELALVPLRTFRWSHLLQAFAT